MGHYVNTERTAVGSDLVSGGCRWCGRTPRLLFAYNGTGHFCNVLCAESWLGDVLPRPIHPAAAR
jgi:hypothetical protein